MSDRNLESDHHRPGHKKASCAQTRKVTTLTGVSTIVSSNLSKDKTPKGTPCDHRPG